MTDPRQIYITFNFDDEEITLPMICGSFYDFAKSHSLQEATFDINKSNDKEFEFQIFCAVKFLRNEHNENRNLENYFSVITGLNFMLLLDDNYLNLLKNYEPNTDEIGFLFPEEIEFLIVSHFETWDIIKLVGKGLYFNYWNNEKNEMILSFDFSLSNEEKLEEFVQEKNELIQKFIYWTNVKSLKIKTIYFQHLNLINKIDFSPFAHCVENLDVSETKISNEDIMKFSNLKVLNICDNSAVTIKKLFPKTIEIIKCDYFSYNVRDHFLSDLKKTDEDKLSDEPIEELYSAIGVKNIQISLNETKQVNIMCKINEVKEQIDINEKYGEEYCDEYDEEYEETHWYGRLKY